MLAEGGMDHSAIEQDSCSIGDLAEDDQRFLELVIVVVCQRLHPRLDFLSEVSSLINYQSSMPYLLERHGRVWRGIGRS